MPPPDLTPPPSQAHTEAVCGAMVRSLTGDASLQWAGQTLYQGTQVVPLVAAHQGNVTAGWDDQRALLDGAALRLRLSDAALHAAHVPEDEVERLVFELLEQLRCESLVPDDWPGMRANLQQRFLRWSGAFVDSGLTETALGILLFTLALTAWSRLTGGEIPDWMSDLVEGTRADIVPEIGGWLAALRRARADQPAFIPTARALDRAGRAHRPRASGE